MKSIDKLLPAANIALELCELVNNDTATIKDGVYDGYLAGFGPAVITSGLIQTIATYVADEKRKKVMNAIAAVAAIDGKLTGEALLHLCLEQNNTQQLNIWRTRIIDASVSLKLMIRTYSNIK
jgi:hypothetical protein